MFFILHFSPCPLLPLWYKLPASLDCSNFLNFLSASFFDSLLPVSIKQSEWSSKIWIRSCPSFTQNPVRDLHLTHSKSQHSCNSLLCPMRFGSLLLFFSSLIKFSHPLVYCAFLNTGPLTIPETFLTCSAPGPLHLLFFCHLCFWVFFPQMANSLTFFTSSQISP